MNAFQDSRVIPVVPNDRRLGIFDQNPEMVSIRYEQDAAGPVYLVVGPSADVGQLTKAANRFGVPLPDLVDIRNYGAKRACKEALRYTGISKYCVLWIRDGKERRSPWFHSSERAHRAREMMAQKYGQAIVYVD